MDIIFDDDRLQHTADKVTDSPEHADHHTSPSTSGTESSHQDYDSDDSTPREPALGSPPGTFALESENHPNPTHSLETVTRREFSGMQKSVKKRKREYVNLFSRLNNNDSKLRTEKENQQLTNDRQYIVNNRQDKNIEDHKWKKTLIAKDTELELHLKKIDLKHIGIRPKLTNIEQGIVELTAKVETMFTPLENTFAYKNMMIQIDDLKRLIRRRRLTAPTNGPIGPRFKQRKTQTLRLRQV